MFLFFLLKSTQNFLTCKAFSFMLQYYIHARHLALSRTFPDKFEMEPSAPPKVKSAFGDEFICILATLQREKECVCMWQKEREKGVSKFYFSWREVGTQS